MTVSHTSRRGKIEHALFWVGVTFKGVDGLLELLAGALLPFVSVARLHDLVVTATAPELAEDPGDLIANALRGGADRFSPDKKAFAVAYLLAHGVVKLGLVGALLGNRRWAFPLALWLLGGFVGYEGFRVIRHHTYGLLILAALDAGVMVLVGLEYRRRWPR
jgi:uncharacterized membrane protein